VGLLEACGEKLGGVVDTFKELHDAITEDSEKWKELQE
jgi:hypothetical protein